MNSSIINPRQVIVRPATQITALVQCTAERRTREQECVVYRGKTNAEWLSAVDALADAAVAEVHRRETAARSDWLHSQIKRLRENAEDHGPQPELLDELVAEYAVLAS